jgi:predicted XRE-type DNA-binding protein
MTKKSIKERFWSKVNKQQDDRCWEWIGNKGKKAGTMHHNAKLTDENIKEIITMVGSGMSQGRVARIYGVDQSGISRICHGKAWQHLTLVS